MKFSPPTSLRLLVLTPVFCLVTQVVARAQDGELQIAQVPVARDAVLYGEDVIDGVVRANGKGELLLVGNIQSGLFRRTLLAFELDSHVPPGSVIVNARLTLSVPTEAFTSFIAVFRVLSPWAGGVTDPEEEFLGDAAQTGDVTWNFRSFNASSTERQALWQQPGGDFSPDAPLLAMAGEGSGDTFTYTSEALVADVQSMLDRPEQHQGWILIGEEGAFVENVLPVASSDHEDESLRPYLEVGYTAPTDFDKVVANYDSLITVAGMGEDGDRDNHWRSRYEGADALGVELSRPSTALKAEDGTIYFTDTYGHAIRKVTPDGRVETVAGSGLEGYNMDDGPALEVQLDQPNGLALMPNGNLYILDIDNKRVRKVTPDGELTTVFHDETDPPFLTGRGLWVSDDEETIIYGSRTALKRWTASDNAITVLVDGFARLTNIGRDSRTGEFLGADIDDDTVWRMDIETGMRQRIAGGGSRTLSNIDAREARLDGVRGIAVSPHGGYFVTTENGGDVWYVDTSGTAHILLPGSGSGNLIRGEDQTLRALVDAGENVVSEPYAITIAPDGDLVLVTNETGVIRVVEKGRAPQITSQRIEADGGYRVEWSSQIQRIYLVEGSTDLENWELLSEVPSTSNATSYIDTEMSANPERFYRVRFYYP